MRPEEFLTLVGDRKDTDAEIIRHLCDELIRVHASNQQDRERLRSVEGLLDAQGLDVKLLGTWGDKDRPRTIVYRGTLIPVKPLRAEQPA